MDIQLLLTVPAPDNNLTRAVITLLLLFGVAFLGLGILMFQGQRRYRAHQRERREALQRLEKESREAEKEAITETREQIARDLQARKHDVQGKSLQVRVNTDEHSKK